jgi:hypothetical protein
MTSSRWSDKDIALIDELLSADKSVGFIAAHFCTTEQNIRMVMSRNNLAVKQSRAGTLSTLEKKASIQDLSTRIRILKGEELRVAPPKDTFSEEQLKSWLSGSQGCVKFCQEVLGVELQAYQIEMIQQMLDHKRFVAVCGRQVGKDFTASCFVLWQSVCNSNSKILLVSASQRASDLLYNRILNFIANSTELFDSVSKSNSETCTFKNNSEIWSLPATGQIRGQTEVTHILVNEAFEVPDETFSAIEPMLAIRNGSLYLFSTPRGCQGKLWEAFNSPFYGKMHLPSTANKYLSAEFIETARQTMPASEFDMEINAYFNQNVDNFFNSTLIDSVSYDYSLHDIPEEKDYFCGIDWGREHDSSVISIVSVDEGNIRVENVIELVKKPFSEQVALISKLHSTYNFKKIVSEYAGLSIPACEQLKEKGLPVTFFKPTIDSKELAFNFLKKKMEDKQLMIPKSQTKLQYELRMFQYEVTSGGKTKLFHLSKGCDDFCDSLNYAIWATKEDTTPLLCNLSLNRERQQNFLKSSVAAEPVALFKEINEERNKIVNEPMTWEQKLFYLQHSSSIRF